MKTTIALLFNVLTFMFILVKGANKRPGVQFVNPVRLFEEDEVKILPGLIFPMRRHYSGYLRADKDGNRFFHYWLSESLTHPKTDPLVVWLGGGYSCSGLLALFTQVGPLRILSQKAVVDNPFAWNKRANIAFIDFPVGSGYSYSVNGTLSFDEEDLVSRIHYALMNLIARKFPHYVQRTLYLVGEDYVANNVLAVANKILSETEIPLEGVLLNAPYLDRLEVLRAKLRLARWWEKYPLSYYIDMGKNNCCARSRKKDCVDIDRRDSICYKLVKDALEICARQISNPWKINDECPDSDALHLVKSFSNLTSERRSSTPEHHSTHVGTNKYYQLSPKYGRWSLIPPFLPKQLRQHLKNRCIDDSVAEGYLNSEFVRASLNIPDKLRKPFAFCTHSTVNYGKIFHPGNLNSSALLRTLIMSPKKPNILIYHGELNWEINRLTLEPFLEDERAVKLRGREPFYINARRGGSRKIFGGISHYTIKDAGYRVASDQPVAALYMFHRFLDGLLD